MGRLLDEDDVVDWLLKRTEMYDGAGHFVDENVVKKNIESQIAKIPTAQPEIANQTEESAQNVQNEDLISRKAVIDALNAYEDVVDMASQVFTIRGCKKVITNLPSAQQNIKQAAKLLSDFIESCPGGDSYLITPDGEELRTDWGYAMEGIQLIYDWAERREE